MNSNFNRNLLIGFGASLIILAITSVASFVSIRNLLNSASLVNQTHEVIIALDAVNATLIDAQSSQRGYLLTGEDAFLEPYIEAQRQIDELMLGVERRIINNEAQQASMRELREL